MQHVTVPVLGTEYGVDCLERDRGTVAAPGYRSIPLRLSAVSESGTLLSDIIDDEGERDHVTFLYSSGSDRRLSRGSDQGTEHSVQGYWEHLN